MHHQKRDGSILKKLLCAAIICLLTVSLRAQTNDITATASTNTADALPPMATLQLQALSDFQSQMQTMMKAMENNRLEIANVLTANSSNTLAQLTIMAGMMADQRAQDLKVVRDEHRVGMAIVVGLAGLLLLTILFLNLTAIKAINRMTSMFSASSLIPDAEAQALADAREAERQRQLVLFPGEQGQPQLGNAMVQLQSRIQALEHMASKMRDGRPTNADSETTAPPAAEKPSHRIR